MAPFILNYSGALLRQYPGPWQVMIKQSDGSYACVAEAAARFTLGEVSPLKAPTSSTWTLSTSLYS